MLACLLYVVLLDGVSIFIRGYKTLLLRFILNPDNNRGSLLTLSIAAAEEFLV
jgi:hypothetical protein